MCRTHSRRLVALAADERMSGTLADGLALAEALALLWEGTARAWSCVASTAWPPAEAGGYNYGSAPFGFRSERGELVSRIEEQPALARIPELHAGNRACGRSLPHRSPGDWRQAGEGNGTPVCVARS